MHRASITKRAVKGVYSLLQPSLVLQGEPPCWRSELGDMATTWGTEQTPYPKRKQREMGIMSIWHIYDKIFSDPIPGRWIHGEWRSCAPTPTKKKCQRGKSKQAVQPSVYVLCGEHGGFIQDNYISVCFQCPNQTANSSLLIYTKVCPLPRSSLCYIKVWQGDSASTHLILTRTKLCLKSFIKVLPWKKKCFYLLTRCKAWFIVLCWILCCSGREKLR